jgi:hypothetical protein
VVVVETPVALAEPCQIVELPAPRIRQLPWTMSRSPEFRRQYCSAVEAALKYRMSAETVRA